MTVQEKVEMLVTMHDNIIEIGDEEIYYQWIVDGVPDEPYEEILEYIAETCFEEVVEVYNNIMNLEILGG